MKKRNSNIQRASKDCLPRGRLMLQIICRSYMELRQSFLVDVCCDAAEAKER